MRVLFLGLLCCFALFFGVGCGVVDLAGTDEVVVHFEYSSLPPVRSGQAPTGTPSAQILGAIQDRLALYRVAGTATAHDGHVDVTAQRRNAVVIRHALALPTTLNAFALDTHAPPNPAGARRREWTSMMGAPDAACTLLFELDATGEWFARCGDAARTAPLTAMRTANGIALPAPDMHAGAHADVIAVGSFIIARDVTDADPRALADAEMLLARARVRPLSAWLDARPLPRLTFASIEPAPANLPLAASVIGIPLLFAMAWLLVLRRFDRSQPEPWWLLIATLLCGGITALGAAGVERFVAQKVSFLNPWRSGDAGPRALVQALVAYTLTVGLVEELAKWLACQLAYKRREFDEPIDGIVYASAAAAGFSLLENVAYLNQARMSPAVLAARTFLTLPAHVFFSALWGYGYGRKLVTRQHMRIATNIFLAVVLHGLFDTLVTTPRLMPAAIVLDMMMAVTFIVLVRRLLRFGSGAAPFSGAERLLYPTGHQEGFAISSIVFVVSSAALFLVCVAAETRGIDTLIMTVGAGLLIAFFVAGWGVTHFVPLDIVVDHEGITFSGVLRRWRDVTRAELDPRATRAHVVLYTARGETVRLGVGEMLVMRRAYETISTRLMR